MLDEPELGYSGSSVVVPTEAILPYMGTPMLAHVAINLRRFSNLRQLPLRELRIVRITAEELKQMIDNAHVAMVVDLRRTLGHEADAYTTPGSLRMTTDELEECH